MSLVPQDDLPGALANFQVVPADDLPGTPSAPARKNDKGFFSNVGELLVEGGKQALAAAEVSPAVIANGDVQGKAGIIAKQLAKPQDAQPQELQEVKGAFTDEGEAWKKAEGFWQSTGAIGQMLFEVGRQALTNPKGLAYMTAEQAANMAPSIAGMIVGGKAGGAAGTAVAPLLGPAAPAGPVIGAIGGAATGAFTGSAPIEIGSEFISLVGKELNTRGLEPTEANVQSLLQDKDFTERAVNDARVKGATTAGIDAAMTVASGGVATGPRRAALKAATAELGVGADAAQIAKRATEILDQRTLLQKAGTGAKAVGVDVTGGGLSEAGGQLAAYGQVDLADVGLEMLGELGGSAIEVPAAGYSLTRDQISRQRQASAQQALQQAPDAAAAAAAANELAGSVDELTASVDAYLSRQAPTPAATPQAERMTMPEQRAMVDRNAELLAQASQAGTEFDRRMALDQAQVALPQPAERTAANFVDLTPMSERDARNRLTVMRDMLAREGQSTIDLAIVPHPSQQGAFAIARQALPSLDLPAQQPTITPDQAQNRIESAALAGTVEQRRAEDMPRQVVIDRALRNVEERGGVASPAEARIFQEAGLGRPYDRIDESLAPALTPDQQLTQATGIALGQRPREVGGEAQRLANLEQANAESMAEQAERARVERAQAERQTQEQIAATSQPSQPPAAGDVIQALVVPGRERTAEQNLTIRQAQARYSPEDFSILQRAANAPFQLNTEERVRLRQLRNPAPAAAADASLTNEGDTPGLLGTRVAERLGQPTAGRVITSGAKLSTTRQLTPGATDTVRDGDTEHQFTVVDSSRLGNLGRVLQQIARIFGKRLVVFESDTLQADGFVLDDDNRNIYVNAQSQISPLAVFGHELLHIMKRDNPVAYQALEAVVRRNLIEGGAQRFSQETGYTEGQTLEEIAADLMGNRFQEGAFWSEVFAEIEQLNPQEAPGIIARLGAALSRAVDAFLRVVKQSAFETDALITDLNAVKAAVREAVVAYAQQQRQPAIAMEAGLTGDVAVGDNVSETNIGARNARFSDTRAGEGVPEAAAADGRVTGRDGAGEIPEYGTAREGAVSVVGRHYSTGQRQALSGDFYGRGLRGAERSRLDGSPDPRLRQRVYFYVDQGSGVRPESGVGGYAHEVRLNNIYDPASRIIPPQANANAFESAVLNAGFDGYLAPFGNNQAAAVLLGPKHKAVPVRALGQVASAPAPQAAAPTTLKKSLLGRELNAIDPARIPGAQVRMGNLEIPADQAEAANAELERIGSTARFSRARPIPESIDDLVKLENVFQRARTGAFKTNRELKVAMQQTALAAARDARVNLAAQTPETEAYLARVGVADALYAIQSNANAVGWYDKTVTKALKILGKIHPEINTDPNAKFAFTWALAVTSNGLKVDKNFDLAERVYKTYRQTGRMPTNITAGKAQKAINDGLGLFNEMVGQYGIDTVRRFMDTKFRASQIKRATGLEPTGENADTKVRGAAVLGPKIGNGFFSNLNGFFDQLTMDRWLMRTWGRWTGTLIEPRPDMVRAKREEVRTLVAELKKDAPAAAEFQKVLKRKLTVGDPDALALAIQKASQDPETRAIFNKTLAGEGLRKAGNSLAGYLDGQKEAPENGNERNFIRKVFNQVLEEVRAKGFPSLTMSDLQALLWYPEKRLYDTAKSKEDAAAEGYDDDEAPDYANAAAKLARANGVSDQDIKSAIREAETEYETRERAGSTQRDAGDQQAEARAEGGTRGFGERGRRQFLTTGIIHRVRSDRERNEAASGPYSRKSGGDGKGLRVLGQPSVAVFSPAAKFKNALSEIPAAAPKFFELDAQGAQLFQDAIQASKDATPFGAAVYVYPLEDYQGMRLFLTQDAKAGFALKGDDIVSVFAGPEQRGAVNAIMQLAVQEGGRRLDAYDTVLPDLYAVHGFKIVARIPWSDEAAQEGWDKTTFQAFNDGEPDVVFMVYDREYFGAPTNEDGEVIENYDDGAVKQREALGGQAPRATLSRQRQAQTEYAEVEARYRDTDQWLKAPNGRPTNLTERQWVQVRTPSFKAWFGDWEKFAGMPGGVFNDGNGEVSKVVDANGEPLVVYHGTNRGGFSVFNRPGGSGRGDLGIFTTPNLDMAMTYMTRRGGEVQIENDPLRPRQPSRQEKTPGYYASFLNIRNPLEEYFDGANWDGSRAGQYQVVVGEGDIEGYFNERSEAEAVAENVGGEVEEADDFYMSTDDAVRDARRYNNDGAILREVVDSGPGAFNAYAGEPTDVFVAFEPNQLKSATQNTGEFNPEEEDIRYSRRRNIFGQQVLATWTAPTDTKFDDFIYVMQDKMVDTKRVVEAVKGAIGRIDDKWNPYLQEELYHGRTAKQTKEFLGDELRPLLQEMQMRDVAMADFEEYLHNRHAEERNKQIAKVNPNMPDGGSGIDTADARAYLAGLSPQQKRDYEALAKRVDAITAGTRQMLVDSGLESADTIAAWEGAYNQYVPLNREDLDFSSSFAGMGTGQGYSVRGSASKRATGSKRDVVDILANIAMQRERAIVRAQKNRVATAVYGLAASQPNTDFWLAVNPDAIKDPVALQAELVKMGLNPLDAQNLIEEPKQTYIDPRTGLVSQRINPALRSSPNVLAVRVDGQDRYVFFNANDERSQRMVSALKNLDADQLGRVMGIAAQITRYFASINTQYNPIFGVINFLRDVQGATLQLSTTPIADRTKEVLANTIPALRGIYADTRAERKGRAKPTGTWATLWEEFQVEGGQTGYRDQFSRSAERAEALERELKRITEGKAKQFGRAVFDWLSDYNETMENAVRLAAYKAGKDKGLSNQQAASIAKNLTVNFNRKGQVATQAGALYAFFNAAVQGTTRLGQTLAGPAGKKIVGGGLLLGTLQAVMLAAAGFDEDEPPEFVRERNFIIPLADGKYLTVPMPLGYNVIPNTSRVMTEFVLSGFRDPAKRVGQITGAFLEMFNPIGNAGWSVQTIAPTIADPLVALSENRDWTGKPIAKKDMSSTDPTPGYTRAKETASWFSKQLSYYLNLASGGTKYQPGLISPTPDQIDYLIGQLTGGVGREILKAEQTVTSSVTGEELPPYKIPLAGRFYGDSKSSAAESTRFYENITRLNEHENEIQGRRKNRENATEYLRENPEARLVTFANQIERDVQKLRQRRRDLLERGASKESIKIIETQITNRMKRLNDRVRALREKETAE